MHLARVHAKAEFLKLINWKIAWGVKKGVGMQDASATKVFGTELYHRGLPAADGGARRGGRRAVRLARARSCAAASSACTGRR